MRYTVDGTKCRSLLQELFISAGSSIYCTGYVFQPVYFYASSHVVKNTKNGLKTTTSKFSQNLQRTYALKYTAKCRSICASV